MIAIDQYMYVGLILSMFSVWNSLKYLIVNTVDFAYYGHGYCRQPLIVDKLVGTEFLMDHV